ncbi:SCO2522 family protein [Actinoplanes solisilvae]|uniref:SCO2522 family protein n=1 Tax=Actinoplanes solisilvae TaxID=2486853 RepID=UPI000FDA94E8|nr:SCO2522 family protein [Actinoplanes solisilvae]
MKTHFEEASAVPRVAQLPLAHLSIELGHLYMEDFAGGPAQLSEHFRVIRPWVDAARRSLTDKLGPGRSPRASTCFLIDDYFTRFSRPDIVIAQLRAAADEHGLTIDYVARESGCDRAGDVALAELVLDRIVADPPPGTDGQRPSPHETGWLYNSDRLPGESSSPAMSVERDWRPPVENARNKHSIVIAVEIFNDKGWACPYLAAVWQLLRLGMLRCDGRAVAQPVSLTGDLPREWDHLPAVLQLNPDAPSFSAYRTVSVLAPRFLPIEAAVRVVLNQFAADDEVRDQVHRRAAGEHLDLPDELVRRIEYAMVGDVSKVR